MFGTAAGPTMRGDSSAVTLGGDNIFNLSRDERLGARTIANGINDRGS